MNKFNNKNLEGVMLQSIKDNFLGCMFKCKKISINIPDFFANDWKNVKTNQFLIVCDLYKGNNLFEENCNILIETKNTHVVKDNFSKIINDIEKQQINLFTISKTYYIVENNYKIVS